MKPLPFSVPALVLVALVFPLLGDVSAQSLPQFLRRPDIHGDQVLFSSEGDLWLGSIERRTAARITTAEGSEGPAYFSPDGNRIAFTAQYDGARDAYIMDTQGGPPTRLTWDPSGVSVLGWTPDGTHVVFRSYRGTTMRTRLWKVPAAGGAAELLPIPYGEFASFHDDGTRIAYVPVSAEWQHWKRYRGGLADDIWLTDTATGTFRRLTDHRGVDTEPVWVGDTVYFVSEREGLANLYSLDPATGGAQAVTSFSDYDVRYPATDGRLVIFEHGDGIAVFDPATGAARDVEMDLHSDRIHARERRVRALDHLAGFDLGPTGQRVLVTARGQVLSAPIEHGDVRALEAHPGSRAQYAAWSKDGKQIAFVSDRSGEEQVWIAPSSGGEARMLTRDHQGPLGPLVWSPDGLYLVTSDREMRVLLVEVKTGTTTVIDQGDRAWSYDLVVDSYRFSPDGKWIAYSLLDSNWNNTIRLYEIAAKKVTRVTSPEMSSFAPAFDAEGKYLCFLSDREFEPQYENGNHYYSFDPMTRVSIAVLDKDGKSPFLEENDEEGDASKDKEEDKDKKDDEKKGNDAAVALPKMRIDLAGLESRIIDVPVPAADYSRVEAVEGKLLLESAADPGDDEAAAQGSRKLQSFDLEKKKAKTLAERMTAFDLSADGKKMLVQQGQGFTIMDATADEIPKEDAAVPTDGWTLSIEPTAEWKQIFNETWRVARDFFYDPGMHGVDWNAVHAKFEPMLAAVAVRSDLSFVLGEMVAELNCGHAYIGEGDVPAAPHVPMGFLGADFEAVDGPTPSYRVTNLLDGDGFDLEQRSPLLTPGARVEVGEYILSVGGRPVRADQDLQALLVGTAGRTIRLQVNSKPSMEGAREVWVEPMATEGQARYYEWVRGRYDYVKANGGDNLGYVHIPNMSSDGFREFGKHYYPNLERDGMIYDVRFNGGGYINAMLLLQISSPRYSYFKPRHGASWSRQDWAAAGYGVALCNDQSGSNAEEFGDAFQRLKIGPLIGTRSWGGEVGSGGGYPLVDGGSVYIPNYAAWVPSGEWIIEGVGVEPDMVVEEDPAALMTGKDPQLDAAIGYLKKRLAEKPIARPAPPPFPDKAHGGSDMR